MWRLKLLNIKNRKQSFCFVEEGKPDYVSPMSGGALSAGERYKSGQDRLEHVLDAITPDEKERWEKMRYSKAAEISKASAAHVKQYLDQMRAQLEKHTCPPGVSNGMLAPTVTSETDLAIPITTPANNPARLPSAGSTVALQ